MTSLWERLEHADGSTRAALSARRIASAAVAVADAHGLDAITMRRLGSELGVRPMAAYRHVSGKDDVIEMMIDLVYGEIVTTEGADWRETLRELAIGVRTLVLDHPWLTGLPSAQAAFELTPNRLSLAERVLAALRVPGFDVDEAMAAFRTVTSYALGTTGAEAGLRQLMTEQGWADGTDTRTGLAEQLAWLLNTGRYPEFERYTREAGRKDDLRWQFETGLNHILDGIASRLDDLQLGR